MTHHPAGLVMSGSEGCVHVRIWDERSYVCSEDLGALLFLGESVPLLRQQSTPEDLGRGCGLARLNRSGRAIVFEVGKRYYLVPRDRFMMIALGEEISWPIAEVVSDAVHPFHASCTPGGATP